MDFDAFFAEAYPSVGRALGFALGDQGAAEDAAQEAFAKAYRRWSSVSQAGRPAAWVYVVAVRDARRRLSRLERMERRVAERPGNEAVYDVAGDADIVAAVAALPARQRLAVVLRYWADLDEASMAEAMGCARGTVKATLSAALTKLRVAQHDEEVIANAH